jgi:DHHC palmitoyltransferase
MMYCSPLQRRFDHHCLLVGNCIGNDNHRFFAGESIHCSTHTSIALRKHTESKSHVVCPFCSLSHGAAILLSDPSHGGVAKAAQAFYQVRLADTSQTMHSASMCLSPCTSAPFCERVRHDLYVSGIDKHGSGPALTCCWDWIASMYTPACFCYLAAGAHCTLHHSGMLPQPHDIITHTASCVLNEHCHLFWLQASVFHSLW